MEHQDAARDLEFVREVVHRTHARVDTHSFHSVIWGLIVLVWYPLSNWFQERENFTGMIVLGVASVLAGMIAGGLFEYRLSKRPRLAGANTFIEKQVVLIVYSCLAAAAALSSFGPANGFIDGRNVPVIWGLVYANMAFMIGVVYTREYLVAGGVIFAGCLLAIVWSRYAGYILGPFMGLGMIVPGILGERRVARLRTSDDEAEV